MALCDKHNRYWYFMQFHCVLIGSLVASSSLPPGPNPSPVVSRVGQQALLPCSWSSLVGLGARLPAANVQWSTPDHSVYERWGERVWAATAFRGRAAVPEVRLAAGDCSLTLSDVQLDDVGLYESFVVVDGNAGSMKRRVFVQSVKLVVYDHKSKQSHGTGEDMVLDLHSPNAARVVFQNRNSTQWLDLWMRGDPDSRRLEKTPDKEQLTVGELQPSDEGTYKVLDTHGLAISTVQLTLQDSAKPHQAVDIAERQVAFKMYSKGDGKQNQCSFPLLVFCLFIIFLRFQR